MSSSCRCPDAKIIDAHSGFNHLAEPTRSFSATRPSLRGLPGDFEIWAEPLDTVEVRASGAKARLTSSSRSFSWRVSASIRMVSIALMVS